ncbi:hypothetical protein [Streptomyces sp. ODS05-4]|uniref:hypothetical protein n=1 Tax=Streptomyces sp. ODS05-4 TaxID=2944939 RepID=UPI00210F05E3|nr:hypothetical protein [Streptomyces sp. ODS05-4]
MTQHGGAVMSAVMTGRRVRLAVVLLAVVLALTGFQSGAHARKGGKSSGGGGCSSSDQGNSDYGSGSSGGGSGSGGTSGGGYRNNGVDDDDTSGGSGGGEPTEPAPTASAGEDAVVTVVDCVESARKRAKGKRKTGGGKDDTTATVRVTSRVAVDADFDVVVEFHDDRYNVVDSASGGVRLAPGETKTVELRMRAPRSVDRVALCEATVDRA